MEPVLADTPGGEIPPVESPPAVTPVSEPMIPKHRLDELSARIKRQNEEIAMKDELIQNYSSQNKPKEPSDELNAEDLGIDQDTFNAARQIASHEIAKVEVKNRQNLGHLANSLEKTQFLMKHGKGAELYVSRVDEFRKRHHQLTGTFLDMETAYKTVKYDEMMAKQTRATPAPTPTTQVAATTPAPVVEDQVDNPPASHPGAAGTNISTPGAPIVVPTDKTLAEMTVDEMEARFEKEDYAGIEI